MDKKPAFRLNPDKELVQLIREGLKQTGGYCPCKLERTEENRCPCLEFRATARCHCGLFVVIDDPEENSQAVED